MSKMSFIGIGFFFPNAGVVLDNAPPAVHQFHCNEERPRDKRAGGQR